ncbi:ASCH domain-containing protein, partial [Acinetobacter baumannii]
VIRTISVDIRRFADVDADFARTEGEGDLTLEWWRAAHRAYYERVLAGSGYTVDDDLLIACERFEVVLLA